MRNSASIIGKTFGRLTVLAQSERALTANKIPYFECACACGSGTKPQRLDRLQNGAVVSCGCLRNENSASRVRTHGKSSTPTWRVWRDMQTRCFNPKYKRYADWGGRGITVCERWLGKHGFENFLADMGERPAGKTLDRRQVNGNYEKSNCRWATPKEQANNRRSS